MTQVVTNSELGAFRTCRARHGFEYTDLLRPKVPGRVLTWGNCVHAGAEAGYIAAFAGHEHRVSHAIRGGRAGVRDFHTRYLLRLDEIRSAGDMGDEEAQERFDDAAKMLDVALWAVPHFFQATQQDLETLVPLGFELPFHVPAYDKRGRATALRLEGKIDAVWWDPQDRSIVIDDHKTTDDLVGTTEKKIAIDPQMSQYMHAVQHLVRAGELVPMDGSELPEGAWRRVGRCRYNCIRRSHPHQPNVNKVAKNDGPQPGVARGVWPEITATLRDMEAEHGTNLGLVSAAALDTTGEIYAAALAEQYEERHLPITEKQRELLSRLQHQGDRYFARFEFWRNADERERWRQETQVEARLMREVARDPSMRTRNAGACSQAGSMPCSFRAVCIDDAPETRALYRIATKRHEEV